MDRDRAPITEGKQHKDAFYFWFSFRACVRTPARGREISSTFQQLLQAGPHDVDVLDAHELEADVGVVVLIFVAFARRSVCQRVQLHRGEMTKSKGELLPTQFSLGDEGAVVRCWRPLTFGLVSIT